MAIPDNLGPPVTDPELLKQLNATAADNPGTPVTDPELLKQLNGLKTMSFGDMMKSGLTGVGRGLAEVPGLPYDVGKLARLGFGKLAGYAEDYSPELTNYLGIHPKDIVDEALAGLHGDHGYGSARIDNLLNQAGILDYKPQSVGGERAFNIGHFIGGALPMGPEGIAKEAIAGGLGNVAARIGKNAIIGTGAGIGSQVGRETADTLDPDNVHPLLRFALEGGGALAGGSGLSSIANRSVLYQKPEILKEMEAAGVKPRFVSDVNENPGVSGAVLDKIVPHTIGARTASKNSAQQTQDELSNYGKSVVGINDPSIPSVQQQGSNIAQAARTTAADLKQHINDTYDDLDNLIPGTTQVATSNSQRALTDLVNRAKDPDLKALLQSPTFQKYQNILSKPNLDWSDMSLLRQEVGQSLYGAQGTEQGLLKQLYGAITNDMRGGAQQIPEGLEHFEYANQVYKDNTAKIEELNNLMAAPPETIPGKLIQQSNKGDTRLSNAFTDSDLAANQPQYGKWFLNNQSQTPAGDFDLERLMSFWNKTSPEARTALTQDPNLATGMDRLKTIYDSTAGSRAIAAGKPSEIGGPASWAASTFGVHQLPGTFGDIATGTALATPLIARGTAAIGQNPDLISRFATPITGGMIPGSVSRNVAGIGTVQNVFPDIYEPSPTPQLPEGPSTAERLGSADPAAGKAYIAGKLGPHIAGQIPADPVGYKAALFQIYNDPQIRSTIGDPKDYE